jgi:Na+-translocating ferredoxin:NAD+ oxidoreductase subunit G
MKVKYISQAWLVLLLSLSFGGTLAAVDVWLAPRIEANKLAASLDMVPELVVGADKPASEKYEPVSVTVGEGKFKTTYDAFWAMSKDDKPLGWVIKASGQGFADKIELLIGVDSQVRNITGLRVLSQKETPGLGNKIEDVGTSEKPAFLNQFERGLRADAPVGVTTADPEKGSNKIKAVTGATISSRAVSTIVNEALTPQLRAALAAAVKAGPKPRSKAKE